MFLIKKQERQSELITYGFSRQISVTQSQYEKTIFSICLNAIGYQ